MDNKDNDDSQSYETPWAKFCYSYFGDTISTTNTLRLSTLTPPRKGYICFKIEGESAHVAKCVKSRALIKVIKSIFDIN